MDLKEARSTYPEIDRLYSLIEKHNLNLRVLELAPELEEISFNRVSIESQDIDITVPAEDEYRDARNSNPALLLQLVINTCDEYEEHEDFLVWSKALGLNASAPQSLNLYKEIAEVTSMISPLTGDYNQYISSYDWELNAGAAQVLRNL